MQKKENSKPVIVDEDLYNYTKNKREISVLNVVFEPNITNWTQAAKQLGLSDGTSVRRIYNRILKRKTDDEGVHSNAPSSNITYPDFPDHLNINRMSVLQDVQSGEEKIRWVCAKEDQRSKLEAIQEALRAFTEDVNPVPPTTPPDLSNNDLMPLYVLTDFHLSMLSWGEETGEDWDIEIAEKTLLNWFGAAIESAPKGGMAVLAQLGDFMHFDMPDALTYTSGNLLDSDTRFHKVVRTAIRLMRKVIMSLLRKHNHVHVIIAEGNHDMMGSVWLSEMFNVLYEQEPRLTVDTNPDPYYAVEWGKTSLFFHHGHLTKINDLDRIMVNKFRDVFGRTTYSYGHSGHLHHRHVKESPLMVWEQHRTLAAKDSYSSRKGYSSGREAQVITYHKDYGDVGRIIYTPEMIGI